MQKGDAFGELALTTGDHMWKATIKAIGDTHLVYLDKEDFLTLIEKRLNSINEEWGLLLRWFELFKHWSMKVLKDFIYFIKD